ncbi:hypothetical protein N7536_000147 [Penicillium majusculum]|nr:hypothetical protein N7536_000147 [Penicillium majusculum]
MPEVETKLWQQWNLEGSKQPSAPQRRFLYADWPSYSPHVALLVLTMQVAETFSTEWNREQNLTANVSERRPTKIRLEYLDSAKSVRRKTCRR